MNKYNIVVSIYFERKYKKISKKQPKIKRKVVEAFKLLMDNPFSINLKTHKVISKQYGEKWASYINKDIRIIWDFDNDKIRVICVMDIGGHSGKTKGL